MSKYSDIFHVVSSYELDDFNYQEIADNERATEINRRWGFISEAINQPSEKKIKTQETESAEAGQVAETSNN